MISPENKTRYSNTALMLAHRLRRRSNNMATQAQPNRVCWAVFFYVEGSNITNNVGDNS